jgi:hypothetical protein
MIYAEQEPEMHYIFTNPQITAIVMGCIIGCIIPIAIVAIICWTIIKANRDDNELKQSMLDRGMSAQDIERVMNAGNTSCKKKKIPKIENPAPQYS